MLGLRTAEGTILVVEDDLILRLDICDQLRGKGYDVIEAVTAEEAIGVLVAHNVVDLVFCDVQLPGSIGGLDFALWAREHCPLIPVILTSGDSAVAERSDQPAPFIAKPYNPDEVTSQIALVLANGTGRGSLNL